MNEWREGRKEEGEKYTQDKLTQRKKVGIIYDNVYISEYIYVHLTQISTQRGVPYETQIDDMSKGRHHRGSYITMEGYGWVDMTLLKTTQR